jgi:hypothetical protein
VIWWRALRDPSLYWMVPAHKTVEFWAVYLMWITATVGFAKGILGTGRPTSFLETIAFVVVLVAPALSAIGALISHRRMRLALLDAPGFVSSNAGKEFLKNATATRIQLLVFAAVLQLVVALGVR